MRANNRFLICALLAGTALWACKSSSEETPRPPEEQASQAAKTVEAPVKEPALEWPAGEPSYGRTAFLELKCYTCHLVSSDAELAKLYKEHGPGAYPAPDIDSSTGQRPDMVLLRQIALPGSSEEARASHMASYADTMTLAQMTNLAAYIKSL